MQKRKLFIQKRTCSYEKKHFFKESKKTRGGNRRVRGGNRRVRGGNFRSGILALCDLPLFSFFGLNDEMRKSELFMTQVNPAVFWPHAV